MNNSEKDSDFNPDAHFPARDKLPLKPGDRLRRLTTGPLDSTRPTESGDTQPSHPTGGSDSTHRQPQENSQLGESQRHPTGVPDQTGGWYGEDGTALPSSTPNDAQTIPSEIDPNSGATRPSTPYRRGEEPTLPPADNNNQPDLPQPVNENDVYATRVTPAAYSPPPAAQTHDRPVYGRRQTGPLYPKPPVNRSYGARPAAPVSAPPTTTKKDWRSSLGCVLRSVIALLFIGSFTLLAIASFIVYQYFSIASTLPKIGDLQTKTSQFETTRILDRNGNSLYEIIDPNAGKRTYVPLGKISPYVVAATIATEDKEFYNHPGFDPLAIMRALWQNYTTGETVSGASTITQQLARALLLSPTERSQRTVQRKAREIVLAAEITRQYSKDEILELYLNENFYGNMSYGIEAAAETYFHTTADKLTLSQAAFLTGLPQAPAVYDVFNNRDETMHRFQQVLVLMFQLSQAKNCIYVSNSPKAVCVSATDAAQAADEMDKYQFKPSQEVMRFPHWVNYIRSVLESQYDAQTIYRSGFTVYTTLDPGLQEKAEQIVKQQIDTLADRHVTDGALVAIRPSTGEILAMVGSADFYNDAISGQVNMAVSPRQPGSSIKPLTYTAAFEKGWTPATLIWDVPSQFPPSGDPSDKRPPYEPNNYDDKFHGPVTVRQALANSFNVPAVKTLQFVGIYDDPKTPALDGLVGIAQRMGITTFTRQDYGLSLTLGGGEVPLYELTSAYGIFANGGRRVPPIGITKIVDHLGQTIYEYQPPAGDQVIRPEHAYLITSILSDNNARAPMFGSNSILNLPFQVAAKTGTTNDFRDNWTLGYTPDLVVGVWVGNADFTPMQNTTGLTGAAPIWSQFMQYAIQTLTGGKPTPFSRPAGIVDRVICAVSGTEPSEWCPSQRGEIFAYDQLPLPKSQDLWQKVNIDTWTGLRASAACSDFMDDQFSLNVSDSFAKKWLQETDAGRSWADQAGFKDPILFTPKRDCTSDDPRPVIIFSSPNDGQTLTSNPVDVYAVVNATDNFKDFRLQYGMGDDPVDWKTLGKRITSQYKQPQLVYSWDATDIPSGKITLRIYMTSADGHYAEKRIHLNLQVPTPTPTATRTPTNTRTPTSTVTDTITPEPSSTNTPTATETPSP